jgi:hypothetical protein
MKSNLNEFLKKIKFEDPSEYDFDADKKIDQNIKETLKNINKSSWCWTLFSCEGHNHDDNSQSLPYFVFIVKKKCIPILLEMLFNTLNPKINNITDFPLCNTNGISVSWGFTDDKYAIISVHWAHNFLEDEEHHKKLLADFYDMSFKILGAKL